MNASEVADLITESLYLYDEENEIEGGVDIRTYDEVGMMTYNKGIVLRVGDKKFQITIIEA
jgi:hypothetical protein